MLGLKREAVKLCEHQKEWEVEAQNTIARLKAILGDVAKDIQHVGSTSVLSIKAKPIIDIAVAVDDFAEILALEKELKDGGFYNRSKPDFGEQLLFASGSLYDGTGDLQTHFIHVVLTNSMDCEALKVSLTRQVPGDTGRETYRKGKHNFIVYTLRKALVKSYLGKTVTIKIDRPRGSTHPAYPNLTYPVHYGHIPGVLGGDGEELDVYLLGVEAPVEEYTASIIGIVHRHNDVEDKLVAAPQGLHFDEKEIWKAVEFQEQYYEIEIETIH